MIKKDDDWVVKFLNLPDEDQIKFLIRSSLEEQIKVRLERRVLESKEKEAID